MPETETDSLSFAASKLRSAVKHFETSDYNTEVSKGLMEVRDALRALNDLQVEAA